MSQLTLYNASSPSPTLGLRLWMTCLPQPRRRQEPQPESLQYGGPPSQSLTAVQTLGGLAAPASAFRQAIYSLSMRHSEPAPPII
jgi:hypothetical protein